MIQALRPFDDTAYGICPNCQRIVERTDKAMRLHGLGHLMAEALREKQAQDRQAEKAQWRTKA